MSHNDISENNLKILADHAERLTVSVVVPTYARPEMLRRCLNSLLRQSLSPCDIHVCYRTDDSASAAVVAELQRGAGQLIREAVVAKDSNLLESLNAGISKTCGDIVALTDDDAEAPPDWLGKLAAAFTRPDIGGVGGLDIQPNECWQEREVGVVRWWGKVIGNHHLGYGPPREVELLKGVNCCFRGNLLRSIGLDPRLRGKGNVSHWEMALCFAMKRQGFCLIYDPDISLKHHIAQRMDGDTNARGIFEESSYVDSVHNATLAILEYLPRPRALVFRIWLLLIGSRSELGLAQVPRLIWQGQSCHSVWRRFLATRKGERAAARTLKKSRKSKAGNW